MASLLFTCVFLQAVVLWEIHCGPIKTGGSYGGGSSKMSQGYQPKQWVDPGYNQAIPMSYSGAQGGSVAIHPPPAHYSQGTPPGTPTDSWAIPHTLFSRGDDVPSSGKAAYGGPYGGPSDVSPPLPPPMPEFHPGQLHRVDLTAEDGGFESETQERGNAPPSTYGASLSPTGLMATLPSFYPYDFAFLTGQYPEGTYTHSSSSVEHGRDDWQENHYLGYPVSPMQGKGGHYYGSVHPSPSDTAQGFQPSGLGKRWGSGSQLAAAHPVYNQDPLVGTYSHHHG